VSQGSEATDGMSDRTKILRSLNFSYSAELDDDDDEEEEEEEEEDCNNNDNDYFDLDCNNQFNSGDGSDLDDEIDHVIDRFDCDIQTNYFDTINHHSDFIECSNADMASDCAHFDVAYDDSDCNSICSLDTEYSFPAPDFSPCRTVEDIGLFDELECEENLILHTNDKFWKGFKLVGDNIDKNIHPSFQRSDNKTDSLHHFHHYAVLDQIDLSDFSESIPTAQVDLRQLLVKRDDISQLENTTIILLSR